MTAATLEHVNTESSWARPADKAKEGGPEPVPADIVVYGDFNCPWSYLTFRRADLLATTGLRVDWRAVEHDPGSSGDRRARFQALRGEMDRVVAMLLPDEDLPYALAGFVPGTRATVAAYAEGYAAGAGLHVGRSLFEAFWMHGIDIGDADVLHTLVADGLSSARSPSRHLGRPGVPVQGTDRSVRTAGSQLVGQWRSEWQGFPSAVVPVLEVPGERPVLGVEAVRWLGNRVAARRSGPGSWG